MTTPSIHKIKHLYGRCDHTDESVIKVNLHVHVNWLYVYVHVVHASSDYMQEYIITLAIWKGPKGIFCGLLSNWDNYGGIRWFVH